jgi:hypothetical protein
VKIFVIFVTFHKLFPQKVKTNFSSKHQVRHGQLHLTPDSSGLAPTAMMLASTALSQNPVLITIIIHISTIQILKKQ